MSRAAAIVLALVAALSGSGTAHSHSLVVRIIDPLEGQLEPNAGPGVGQLTFAIPPSTADHNYSVTLSSPLL